MINREQQVFPFFEAGGHKTESDGGEFEVHFTCFAEELTEFNEALAEYLLGATDENRENLIKEWADVQYTLSLFPLYFEFDGEEAFTRVANNNMTKVVNGKIFRRADGKILKPDDYVKPDMKGL